MFKLSWNSFLKIHSPGCSVDFPLLWKHISFSHRLFLALSIFLSSIPYSPLFLSRNLMLDIPGVTLWFCYLTSPRLQLLVFLFLSERALLICNCICMSVVLYRPIEAWSAMKILRFGHQWLPVHISLTAVLRYFTHHTVHALEWCPSMVWIIVRVVPLAPHTLEHFYHPIKKLLPIGSHFPCPLNGSPSSCPLRPQP